MLNRIRRWWRNAKTGCYLFRVGRVQLHLSWLYEKRAHWFMLGPRRPANIHHSHSFDLWPVAITILRKDCRCDDGELDNCVRRYGSHTTDTLHEWVG